MNPECVFKHVWVYILLILILQTFTIQYVHADLGVFIHYLRQDGILYSHQF